MRDGREGGREEGREKGTCFPPQDSADKATESPLFLNNIPALCYAVSLATSIPGAFQQCLPVFI